MPARTNAVDGLRTSSAREKRSPFVFSFFFCPVPDAFGKSCKRLGLFACSRMERARLLRCYCLAALCGFQILESPSVPRPAHAGSTARAGLPASFAEECFFWGFLIRRGRLAPRSTSLMSRVEAHSSQNATKGAEEYISGLAHTISDPHTDSEMLQSVHNSIKELQTETRAESRRARLATKQLQGTVRKVVKSCIEMEGKLSSMEERTSAVEG
ncbi:hypothetical protein NDU88_000829 [Pleurodeles waltl]|uniref:Uncharacterized protein n=1 Tax=Pleurodeles waltl TaxID=8319 RepID=A0AAV7TG46_PLEWA|nr:hypothetical protein NDU88_000829 [Pleurodeles waltl]